MTNSITVALVVLIEAIFLLDATVLHMNLPLQAARGFAQFVEWLSFWR